MILFLFIIVSTVMNFHAYAFIKSKYKKWSSDEHDLLLQTHFNSTFAICIINKYFWFIHYRHLSVFYYSLLDTGDIKISKTQLLSPKNPDYKEETTGIH